MLIRWAQPGDIPGWLQLAKEVGQLFNSPRMHEDPEFLSALDRWIGQTRGLVAVDRVSGRVLGAIGFSQGSNSIHWFAVSEGCRRRGIGTRLLRCAVNQLDWDRDMRVVTFTDDNPQGRPARRLYQAIGFEDAEATDYQGHPRRLMLRPPTGRQKGGSFHYNYHQYAGACLQENCPCCRGDEMPSWLDEIARLPHSFVMGEKIAQGRLFGKCHVLAKRHAVHLHELRGEALSGFMADVARAGEALLAVSGAVKINYEIHGNSAAHLHAHLFPRYLDDDFPSAPIDYRLTTPSPYESQEEYRWFLREMEKRLRG